MNGIKLSTSPPYHAATNGAAENAVKSFKNAINKMLNDKFNKGTSFDTLVNRYLFNYRNSPHCTTGVSPAQRMFGRKIRTRLDVAFENKNNSKNNESKNKGRNIKFKEGEIVYVRDHRNPNKKSG